MDCSLPGSSVHEILQARILGQVAISFSGRPRDQIGVLHLLPWQVGSFTTEPGLAGRNYEAALQQPAGRHCRALSLHSWGTLILKGKLAHFHVNFRVTLAKKEKLSC